jgi:hypothetical protein
MNTMDNEVIEASLDSLGVAWKRRDPDWVVTVGPLWPYQVVLARRDTGLHVEADLVSWDELGQPEKQALGELLARAEAGLTGVRFELRERQALVWAEVSASADERDVTDAVSRVETAARLLGREASALLNRDVAEVYLRFFGADREIAAGAGRM